MRTNVSGGGFCREYARRPWRRRSSCGCRRAAARRSTRHPRCLEPPSRAAAPRRSRRCAARASSTSPWDRCAPPRRGPAGIRGSTSRTRRKLRISRPAPTRSTHARATSGDDEGVAHPGVASADARPAGAFLQRGVHARATGICSAGTMLNTSPVTMRERDRDRNRGARRPARCRAAECWSFNARAAVSRQRPGRGRRRRPIDDNTRPSVRI